MRHACGHKLQSFRLEWPFCLFSILWFSFQTIRRMEKLIPINHEPSMWPYFYKKCCNVFFRLALPSWSAYLQPKIWRQILQWISTTKNLNLSFSKHLLTPRASKNIIVDLDDVLEPVVRENIGDKNSFLKIVIVYFFKGYQVRSECTNQWQYKMGRIYINLRSGSLAVSIRRRQEANTVTMYGLSKPSQSNFRSFPIFWKKNCNINFLLILWWLTGYEWAC